MSRLCHDARRLCLGPIVCAGVLWLLLGWANPVGAQTAGGAATGAQAKAGDATTRGDALTGGDADTNDVALDRSLTTETVDAKLQALEGAKLEPEQTDQARKLLEGAKSALAEAARLRQQAEQLEAQAKAAPEETKKIRADLEQPLPELEPVEKLAQGLTLQEVEAEWRKADQAATASKQLLDQLKEEVSKQRERPKTLQDRLNAAKAQLTEIEKSLAAAPPPGEPQTLTEARRTSLQARQAMTRAEIALLEKELANLDVLSSLRTAQRDRRARQHKRLEDRAKAWQDQLQKMKEAEARRLAQEAAEAKRALRDAPDHIRKLAVERSELAEDYRELQQKSRALDSRVVVVERRLEDVKQSFDKVKDQVKVLGLNQTIGQVLRQQRRTLPNPSVYQKEAAEFADEIGRVAAAQIEIDRKQNEMTNVEQRLDAVLRTLSPQQREEYRQPIRENLEEKRNLLNKLSDSYATYRKKLSELVYKERQLVTETELFIDFIDEHVLWIRSTTPLGTATLNNLGLTMQWLGDARNWRQLAVDLGTSVRDAFLIWLLCVFLVIGMFFVRRAMLRRMVDVNERIRKVSSDSFLLTLQALLLSVVAALPIPLALFLFGRLLWFSTDAGDFTRAVGRAVMVLAPLWLTFGWLKQATREGGLFGAHFRWSEPVRQSLGRTMFLAMAVLFPITVLIVMMRAVDSDIYIGSLGQLLVIIGNLFIAVLLGRFVAPGSAVMTSATQGRPEGWLAKLRGILWVVLAAPPVTLAIVAALGYLYTAAQLQMRMWATIWLVVALVVVHECAMRWLFVTQRRLALEEAKRKREAARKELEKKKESAGGDSVDFELPPLDEPEASVAQISEQTRGLVRTGVWFAALIGLWLVWSSALPALALLDDVGLWAYGAAADGSPLTVSVADVILAMLVFVITGFAAKNIPGTIEIVLLSRLPLDAGARFAMTTISRYVITAIGIIVAFGWIGVSWSNLQWLIAALSVGLGFGLQEIVANFVSGIIILFERPYRVGDIITVGNTSGVVSKIRIRATTIVDWDRFELIVPNKTFITGQLINWSLTDPITRVTVKVGIAYGSDTTKAEELLYKVAHEHPMVMDEPAPSAFFMGFGDSSLLFELRIFTNSISNRLKVMHELHRAIDAEFKKAGITISFPQRDVHIDSLGPLEVRMVRDKDRDSDRGKRGDDDDQPSNDASEPSGRSAARGAGPGPEGGVEG